MTFSRRLFLSQSTALIALSASPAFADDKDLVDDLVRLIFARGEELANGLAKIEQRGGQDLVTSVILVMRFSRAGTHLFEETLSVLTGESRRGWYDWSLWIEENPQIASHPAYISLKRELFLQIDPNFDAFLKPDYLQPEAMRIRLEEIAWGGVRKDGIPSLDNPDLIPAEDATYLQDDDLVFGVEINGDARAYPLRIMGWHEMFNDVIGDVPVALAYCTLCGAGILFETQLEGRATPLVFGSSGFLYRSNKLMFDRETSSLWNQFTGKPVSGKLVDSEIELRQRPVVITQWKHWRATNPGTQVLSVNTGHKRDYGSGVVYQEYFASPDLMFPTLVDQSELRQKDYVFGIRAPGGAKAWPLTAFDPAQVINDEVGFQNVVLIGDAATRTVRAYARDDLTFDADLMADGVAWTITEQALMSSDGRSLARVAGHVAYWFAWSGYLGDSATLYRP